MNPIETNVLDETGREIPVEMTASIVYQDGRSVLYDYGMTDGVNDNLNRVETIGDGVTQESRGFGKGAVAAPIGGVRTQMLPTKE